MSEKPRPRQPDRTPDPSLLRGIETFEQYHSPTHEPANSLRRDYGFPEITAEDVLTGMKADRERFWKQMPCEAAGSGKTPFQHALEKAGRGTFRYPAESKGTLFRRGIDRTGNYSYVVKHE